METIKIKNLRSFQQNIKYTGVDDTTLDDEYFDDGDETALKDAFAATHKAETRSRKKK